MNNPWEIAIAMQVFTSLDRKHISGIVGYGATHPGFRFRDIIFTDDAVVPQRIAALRPDGAIVNLTKTVYDQLADQFPDVPMVNIGTDVLAESIPSVCGKKGEGSRALLSHLRQQGYRRFAYLGPEKEGQECIRAKNLDSLLLPGEGPLTFFYVPGYDEDNPPVDLVAEQLRDFADPDVPTGIITYDGYRGAAVVEACHKLGIRVPQEIGVATYLEMRTCLTVKPAVSSIESNNYEQGYMAMKLLHQMLEGSQAPKQPVEVEGCRQLIRGSTCVPDVCRDEIRVAVRFMEQNIESGLSVEDCLAHVGSVSRARFYRVFCQQVGMPPAEYYRTLKINRAKELLVGTPLSITRVAGMCGFSSVAQFSSTFKRVVKQTPRQYRNSMAGTALASA